MPAADTSPTRRTPFIGRLLAAAVFFVPLLVVDSSHASPEDDELRLDVSGGSSFIESRRRGDQLYFRVDDMRRALRLRGRESNSRRGIRSLQIQGPGGRLLLLDESPLVDYRGQKVQISAPVWRRRRQEWYVPEDFLTRALPLIVEATFTRVSARHYRLDELRDNRVEVRLNNYAEYVRIVFEPEIESPIRVSELPDRILVEFRNFRVRPDLSDKDPDPGIVRSIEFSRMNVFGTFEIRKGRRYKNFRQFELRGPYRKVVDIYADRRGRVNRNEDVAPPPLNPDRRKGFPAPEPALSGNIPSDQLFIVLDPGHGGGVPGPVPDLDIQEDDYALDVARRIRRRLGRTPFEATLTRTRDVELALDQRSAIANHYNCQAFLSLHLGRSSSKAMRGPVVYYHTRVRTAPEGERPPDGLTSWVDGQQEFHPQSRRLALILQTELNKLFGTSNRAVEAPLTVLEPVAAPAVLVEMGFVSNEDDRERLLSGGFVEDLAETIVSALERFAR